LPDLTSAFARVDDVVARAQAHGRAPSLIAAIVRDGTVVHVSRAGETPVPHRDTQFRIGSISKTFTAAVLLGLRDEGRLRLDDRLDQHLPGTGVGEVHLRQLLGHVAGLQREPEGSWWERSAGTDLATLAAGVTAEKLAFPGYQRHHYSNLAYGLLGGVIERLTGQSWWEAVSTRLLRPLGLDRTTYQAEEPFARGYVRHPWLDTLREEPRHDAGAMAPAGQMWSTVTDLSRWAAVLAQPPAAPGAPAPTTGPGAVVTPTVLRDMCAPAVIVDPEGWTSGAGLGLQLWRQGERVFVGHTGSMPGYLAVLVAHRPSGTAVVAFANSYTLPGWTIGGLGFTLLRTVLDAVPEPTPVPWRPRVTPPADVAPLCGRWWWMGREFQLDWDAEAGQLVLTGTRAGSEEWRFAPEGADRWRGLTGDQVGELLRVRRAGGDVVALDLATFVFSRDPLADD
jgi:CubicO group peptidase (beta-lactamase class C family)